MAPVTAPLAVHQGFVALWVRLHRDVAGHRRALGVDSVPALLDGRVAVPRAGHVRHQDNLDAVAESSIVCRPEDLFQRLGSLSGR
jgi:hypothetical protein